MIKPRWEHSAFEFELSEAPEEHVALTIRTGDDADHTFLFDRDLFARLSRESGALQLLLDEPKEHPK
jgi:hypothetical protein